MHRSFTLAALSGVAAASVGVTAWAVSPSATPVQTSLESRVVHLYNDGPSGSCDADSCGVQTLQPVTFRLPAKSTTYSGTITVSLGYATTGDGVFDLVPELSNAGTHHDRGTILPSERRLAPAPDPTSATVVYQVTDVPANTSLDLDLGLVIGRGGTRKTSFSSGSVLLELRVSPGS